MPAAAQASHWPCLLPSRSHLVAQPPSGRPWQVTPAAGTHARQMCRCSPAGAPAWRETMHSGVASFTMTHLTSSLAEPCLLVSKGRSGTDSCCWSPGQQCAVKSTVCLRPQIITTWCTRTHLQYMLHSLSSLSRPHPPAHIQKSPFTSSSSCSLSASPNRCKPTSHVTRSAPASSSQALGSCT